MKATFRIARIAGIEIGIHYTWLLAVALVTWALGHGLFPEVYPNWDGRTYWVAAGASALLLFLSVFLHELGHSLTALLWKLPVKSITLFMFGGVSNLGGDAPSAKAEFVVSLMGPVVSIALGAGMWAAYFVAMGTTTPRSARWSPIWGSSTC